MAQVLLSDVRKTYEGGVEAVKGVDLQIADGEFVVLVGESGCGKSTTLRMIAGLEDITSGTVTIGDRVVNAVHPKDRDIAMVFQNYALYPHMTVYNNMAFALKLRKTPKADIDRRVRHAAGILGIEHLLDRKPKALSGGQRQRVALGRAIVREPKCFLFDEPLSNLDAKLRVTTRGELKRLHQRLGTTTVYVTHDQEEAMTLGDRVCVMAEGVIQQADNPFDVYRYPVNRFVAGFIGTPPMNFIDGAVQTQAERSSFVADNATVALTPQQHDALGGFTGPAVLGVRPQFLEPLASDAPISPESTLEAKVLVVEPLGDQMDLYLALGSNDDTPRLTARVPSTAPVTADDTCRFRIDAARCHVFEPGDFGSNLTLAHKASTDNAVVPA